MRTQTLQPRSRITRSVAGQALRWAVIDALIGAGGGSLYGLLFAGLGALLQGDPGKITATALYFAACGSVAGALVGAFGALITGETCPHSDETIGGKEARPHASVGRGLTPAYLRQPVNRIASLESRQQQTGSAAPKHTSWN